MAFHISIKENNTNLILKALGERKSIALEAIGLQAENYAKLNLYPGHGKDTGRLQNSITHAQEDENTEVIGTNVEYAHYVELGTQRSKPIPYLKPAVMNHIDEYKRIVEQYLRNG